MSSSHSQDVKRYYEINTKKFLRTAKDAGTHNIHQPLWASKDDKLLTSINYSNQLVLDELLALDLPSAAVLDLGCGVGSSLLYLSQHYPKEADFVGITISPTQVEIASAYIEKHDIANVQIREGNFQQLAESLGHFDLIYAIEAFAHSPDAQVFFKQVSQRLKAGGKLILIDDMLAQQEVVLSSKQLKKLDHFKRGWMMGSIYDHQALAEMAGQVNLEVVDKQHLTPMMKIGRPRDKFLGLLSAILGPLMERSIYLHSLKGGYFKQACIREGIIQYWKLVFQKSGST